MKTFAFTTDASNPDESIVVQSYCTEVIIYEDNQVGTADYKLRAPSNADAQITRPAGAKTTFKPQAGGNFGPNQVIGFISAATGSLNMVQEEY